MTWKKIDKLILTDKEAAAIMLSTGRTDQPYDCIRDVPDITEQEVRAWRRAIGKISRLLRNSPAYSNRDCTKY